MGGAGGCGPTVLGPDGLLEKHSSGSAWKGRVSSCCLLDRDGRAPTPTSGTALAPDTRVWHRPRQDHAVTVQMRDTLRHLPTWALWLSREGHQPAGGGPWWGVQDRQTPRPSGGTSGAGSPRQDRCRCLAHKKPGQLDTTSLPLQGSSGWGPKPLSVGQGSGPVCPQRLPAHPAAPLALGPTFLRTSRPPSPLGGLALPRPHAAHRNPGHGSTLASPSSRGTRSGLQQGVLPPRRTPRTVPSGGHRPRKSTEPRPGAQWGRRQAESQAAVTSARHVVAFGGLPKSSQDDSECRAPSRGGFKAAAQSQGLSQK